MERILSIKNKFIILGLIISIAVFIFSLIWRFPHGDEGILAEQAYYLQKIGYVKSPIFKGLGFGWEYVQYHYHKLFIAIGAVIINVFGVELLPLRLFVLSSCLALMYFLVIYLKKYLKLDTIWIYIFTILIFFQFHFLYFSFIFRPEIPLALFGFLSFFFMNKLFVTEERKYLVYSSLFAGSSALIHLNGLVFIASGYFLLIIFKKWKFSFVFIGVATLTSLLYFFNINSIDAFNGFLHQFSNDPNLHKEDFSLFLKVFRLLEEHKRYFHSPKEIVLSVLFITAIALNFKKLWHNYRLLVVYIFLVLIFASVIVHDKTDKYIAFFVPFQMIVIVVCLSLYDFKIKTYNFLLYTSIIAYFAINSMFIFKIIDNGFNVAERNGKHAQLLKMKGVTILTRENFFFNQYENYNIVSVLSLQYRNKRLNNREFENKDFYMFAKEINAEYILLENESYNKKTLKTINYNSLAEGKSYFGYKLIKKNSEFILFERANNN